MKLKHFASNLHGWEEKEETVYVMRGTLRLHHAQGDEEPSIIDLPEGSSFHIAPLLRHRFEAIGEVDLLEASTPQIDDVVRLEDRYGRVR